jgi:subtilisin family serine protease
MNNRTTTRRRWTLALCLSFLIVINLYIPPPGRQQATRGQIPFSLTATSVVLADGDDDGGNEEDPGEFVDNEVIVELAPEADANQIAADHQLTVLEQLDDTDIYRMGFSSDRTVEQVLDELDDEQQIETVEANYIGEIPELNPRTIPFLDPRTIPFLDGASPGEYFDQAALQRIRADEAHGITRGQGVTVAVIDTGIDPSHPALSDRIAHTRLDWGADGVIEDFSGYDAIDVDLEPWESCPENPQDAPGCGHGTFVAGIVSLVAPEAKILPFRVFNEYGQGNAFDITVAIYLAVASGAQVINMSFGMPQQSRVVNAALNWAHWNGVILVASAGNQGRSLGSWHRQYPAMDFGRNDWVIAVAATDAFDVKADFSNYGRKVDVSAPGVDIYSAYPTDPNGQPRFGIWSGTSFAAPFVAGQAALLHSAVPPPNDPDEAVTRMWTFMQMTYQSAVNIDALNPRWARKLGRGRIDVAEALYQLLGP